MTPVAGNRIAWTGEKGVKRPEPAISGLAGHSEARHGASAD